MSSLTHEIAIDVEADNAWRLLADFKNAHRAFAGVLTGCTIDDDVRTVTFANGRVLRERLIGVDNERMRIAYAGLDEAFQHYNGAMQIVSVAPGQCRFIWIVDVLPHARDEVVMSAMKHGAAALKRVLEAEIR